MILRLPKPIDWPLYLAALALQIFGIIVISSLGLAGRGQLITNQIIFAAIGVVLAGLLTALDYRTFKVIANYLYFAVIGLLVLVLLLGTKVFGATRWIDLGIFQFQPSELAKPILVMTLSKLLTERTAEIKTAVIAILVTAVPFVLTVTQPDLGTALIMLLTALAMLALKGFPRRFALAGAVIILALLPIFFSGLRPYQRERLVSFFNPAADPLGSGYNTKQSLIAVGSGGLMGRGLGQGSQSQLQFLPVAHIDFIFAGVAEATGFLGSLLLIGLIAVLLLRIVNVARVAQDEFGYYFAFGAAFLFFFSASINIGVNLGLLPATGIPLPLVSYGGTQTITSLATIGILQSIYLRHKKIRFS